MKKVLVLYTVSIVLYRDSRTCLDMNQKSIKFYPFIQVYVAWGRESDIPSALDEEFIHGISTALFQTASNWYCLC